MAKIYTQTGDKGQTSLVGGKRVSKTHPRLEAYGTVDEFSSHLGLLASMIEDEHHRKQIQQIQSVLFDLSTILATEPESKYQPSPLDPALIDGVEAEIDALQAQLPSLRSFILPGGTMAASQAHVCRTVCRRTERRILQMTAECEVDPNVLRYVNRLSDYLFVLARHINFQAGTEEILKTF